MQHHIFLSYSRKDIPFMQRVRKDFTRSNLSVWTDEGIEPGTTSWQLAIERAIMNSGCIVCILSPDAAKSDWVREELNFARLQQKDVFLMLARGDERASVPFGYSLSQWVDIRTRKAYKDSMIKLISVLYERLHGMKLSPTKALPAMPPTISLAPTGPLLEDPPCMTELFPHPFDWCDIPFGDVEVEGVLQEVNRFYMGKYEVTNKQFQLFLDDPVGYRDPNWFSFSAEAKKWHRGIRSAKQPLYNDFDLPRTDVNWYEAVAYCRWLQEKSGTSYTLTLPTEAQWQRAAQGDDGRLYPWGNQFDKNHCNTLTSNIGKPLPVMAYPSGASPFGVFDMCGNVAEWTLTEYEGSQNTERDVNRIVRGGAYDSGRMFIQVMNRSSQPPHSQTDTVGFRICANFPD
jgi:hypothetical protein